MDSSALQTLFGPLSRKYCIWFYWLSILGFVLLILAIVGALVGTFSKKIGFGVLYAAIPSAIAYAIFYFQNRLLYSMCSGKM